MSDTGLFYIDDEVEMEVTCPLNTKEGFVKLHELKEETPLTYTSRNLSQIAKANANKPFDIFNICMEQELPHINTESGLNNININNPTTKSSKDINNVINLGTLDINNVKTNKQKIQEKIDELTALLQQNINNVEYNISNTTSNRNKTTTISISFNN